MSPLSVPKIFMAGGGVGFAYYLYMRQYWFPNPYKTQGVQNIEDRFSAGGGHPTHTPGYATKRGSSTDNESRTQDGHKGPDSEHFKENISSQQSEPVWPAKFNEIQYNNPKGK
ncbi:hypothetical protein SNOG_03790 [Parastagonospora nodorum SN15]|uniref:Uncharacterized protein n=1 Tax=Phaeosphaeria nodorum (strain SN15 / ATCC MYA-4574 / FGSC 10173) TaxID=321614 RepID=Q0UWS4_PHANO|nr:hypothetical protein SNOG_03790 [Parastagonospora nodorum SN15]EAT88995.1 hypothetical protein SNOG_03790 [Parastagonospora nodorum SN15]KAH6024498.1 hypothetical protein HBI83_077400 [Parastagonospora nodorum]